MLVGWACVVAGHAAQTQGSCANEPSLEARAGQAGVILVGTISRVEDLDLARSRAMASGDPANVRLIFSGREALKGRFHQQLVILAHRDTEATETCPAARLEPRKLAAVFLAGDSSPFTLVGGADGIVYLRPDEVAGFKRAVGDALAKEPRRGGR
jgi:hypothetical protein